MHLPQTQTTDSVYSTEQNRFQQQAHIPGMEGFRVEHGRSSARAQPIPTHSLKHSRSHPYPSHMHSPTPSLTRSLTHSPSLIHSLTLSLVQSLTPSLTHSGTHSLTYSSTYSLTHTLANPYTKQILLLTSFQHMTCSQHTKSIHIRSRMILHVRVRSRCHIH